jgi:chromate reductase, NAD(P)H dehydrogenase (quinone)
VRILAVSGSLRASSSNSSLIKAAALLAPPGIEVDIYEGLGGLPHFDPDCGDTDSPQTVVELRARLNSCDAVLICSPEYAHGVPGVLKNALDWLVGSGELIDKPVAIINAAPHATHAHASLLETVSVMSGRIVHDASIPIPLAGRKLDAAGIAADPALAEAVVRALGALARALA